MILVVGGAGYIGSHLVKELVEKEQVIVLDNLSTGYRYLVDDRAVFVQGDLGNRILNRFLKNTRFKPSCILRRTA